MVYDFYFTLLILELINDLFDKLFYLQYFFIELNIFSLKRVSGFSELFFIDNVFFEIVFFFTTCFFFETIFVYFSYVFKMFLFLFKEIIFFDTLKSILILSKIL